MSQQKVNYPISQSNLEAVKLGQKMILQHHPKGFLTGHMNLQSSGAILELSETGFIPLHQYFERSIVSTPALSNLFQGLIKPLMDMEKYYLDSRYISITSKDVYIHPQKNELAYVYGSNPAEEGKRHELKDLIKSFIREIIYEQVRLEHPNSKLVTETLTYLKEPGWHLKGLLYLFEQDDQKALGVDLSGRGQSIKERGLALEKDKELRQRQPVRIEDESPQNPEKKSFQSKSIQLGSRLKQNALDNKDMEKNHVTNKVQVKNQASKFLIPLTIVLLAVLITIIRGLPIASNEKLGLILILVSCVLYEVYKILKRGKAKDQGSKDENLKKSKAHIPIQKAKVKESSYEVKEQAHEPKERFVLKKGQGNTSKTDRTVVRKREEDAFMLIGENGQKILLNKDLMQIGRQEDVVDIFIDDNPSIGRQHAQLIRLETGYAVKDLKSVNGTFVNAQKVLYDQAIALQDGDTLGISNVNFEFKAV